MKLFVAHPSRVRWPARLSQGFTLVEMMIATALMITCIVGGLIAVNLMGLREEALLESKAGASDSARRNINQFRRDIYSAKGWGIGFWDGTTFTALTNGVYQQGNALILYPTIIMSNQVVNTNAFALYYYDTSQLANYNGLFCQYSNGVTTILLSNLISPLYISSEDYLGNTQTVRTFKGVVHATFQYAQYQYPLTQVGSNCLFNSYRTDVRATPHLPD
ncbi:MAG: prepilin-type N-terminal cleavage/methylation domain-containing protein [Verrucomicrobiia bacterium]